MTPTRTRRSAQRPGQTPWPITRRGSILIAGMMTVSTLMLVSLTMITMTLGDRLRTTHQLNDSAALQWAHSGVELVLWEINFGGDNFGDLANGGTALWQEVAPLLPPADPNNACVSAPLALQAGSRVWRYTPANLQVLVDKSDPTPNPTTYRILTCGTSNATNRRINITVNVGAGAGPQPGVFDYAIYTQSERIYLYGASPGAVLVDGYTSDCGPYNASSNRLPANEVVIASDQVPYRYIDWNTRDTKAARQDAARAVVVDGYVELFADIEVRTPAAGESPLPTESPDYVNDPAFAIYQDGQVYGGVPGSVVLHGTAGRNERVSATQFEPFLEPDIPAVTSWSIIPGPNGGFGPPGSAAAYNEWQVCAHDTPDLRKFGSINLEGAKLVLGCTDDGGAYDCASTCTPWTGISHTKNDPVEIWVGDGDTQGGLATHAFRVDTDTYWGTGTPGSIEVYSPTEIDYHKAGSQQGVKIGGNGIKNQVFKNSNVNNPDPAKLTLFGDSGNPATITFTTNTRFDGAIYDLNGDVQFQSPNLEFYGAIHSKFVRTDNAGSLQIHWDRALKQAGCGPVPPPPPPGCDPATHNCKPAPGTWQILNN